MWEQISNNRQKQYFVWNDCQLFPYVICSCPDVLTLSNILWASLGDSFGSSRVLLEKIWLISTQHKKRDMSKFIACSSKVVCYTPRDSEHTKPITEDILACFYFASVTFIWTRECKISTSPPQLDVKYDDIGHSIRALSLSVLYSARIRNVAAMNSLVI